MFENGQSKCLWWSWNPQLRLPLKRSCREELSWPRTLAVTSLDLLWHLQGSHCSQLMTEHGRSIRPLRVRLCWGFPLAWLRIAYGYFYPIIFHFLSPFTTVRLRHRREVLPGYSCTPALYLPQVFPSAYFLLVELHLHVSFS